MISSKIVSQISISEQSGVRTWHLSKFSSLCLNNEKVPLSWTSRIKDLSVGQLETGHCGSHPGFARMLEEVLQVLLQSSIGSFSETVQQALGVLETLELVYVRKSG